MSEHVDASKDIVLSAIGSCKHKAQVARKLASNARSKLY